MFSAASSARQATHDDVQAPSAAESDGDEDEEDAEVENIRLPAGNADYQNVSFRPKEREGHNVGSDDSENGQ